MLPDPFDTAALRRAVLDAWAASPARFREDANAEEDLLRGGYRDRWFVELAQNAADAAARAGRPTWLHVSLVGSELRVAGHGEPLTAAGVAALASLRASAQRSGTSVGRFGVGFAAVTAVSDAPRVVSTSGAVAFDRARTARAVAELGSAGLSDELARRDGWVPALRLVWPEDATPDLDGEGTEVRLPLRAGLDPETLLDDARAQVADLLLALPWLAGVEVGRSSWSRVSGVPSQTQDSGQHADRVRKSAPSTGVVTIEGPSGSVAWRVVRASGPLPADPDRAVEDRTRTSWEVTWAVPVDSPLSGDVLHAPTPTDEPTTLPARLLATVPLDPDRRHVRVGATTDHVLAAAAAAYPDLVLATPHEQRVALVPRPGLPASGADATLRDAVVEALRSTAWLPGVDGDDLVPARATVLDPSLDVPGLAAVLDGVVGGLAASVPAGELGTLATLGVTRLDPAGLAETLAGLTRPPAWWRTLYAALSPLDARVRDELGALPVPLADGRTVLGARGALLVDADGPVAGALAALDVPGLRVVHPDAAHPLLAALGATDADPTALLSTPALREAVDRSLDDAEAGLDVGPLATLVLALVRDPDPLLGALALPDADGEYRRADELLLPGGALAGLVDADDPFGVLADAVAAAHPAEALTAVGVLDGFAILRDDEPGGPCHDLDDEEAWWSEEVDPAESDPGPLVAVRDLELVVDWSAAWRVLAAERSVREALTPGSYTSWWLAHHGRLAGRAPTAWRLADAGPDLVGLYDPVPAEAGADLDAPFLAAVGVRSGLVVRDAADAVDLLERLADPARTVDAAATATAHAALATAVADDRVALSDVEPPPRVRTADGVVHDADPDRSAPPVVLDQPWLLGVFGADAAVLPGAGDPRVLADLLDVALAGERVRGLIRSAGTPTPWRRLPEAVAWAAVLGVAVPVGDVVVHERLHVLVTDDERPGAGVVHTPHVWREPDGTLHTDDPARALAAVTIRATEPIFGH